MADVLSKIYLDLAQRCVVQTVGLVMKGQEDDALQVANLAVDLFDRALGDKKDEGGARRGVIIVASYDGHERDDAAARKAA